MADSFEISTELPATPQRVFAAWLSGQEHGRMTGGHADIDAQVGGAFSAWDGYITGTTLELQPDRRIVQAWRSADFPADSPDSRLEIELTPTAAGTRLTLRHSNIPAGQGADYESGWGINYFEPMQRYFTES